MLRHGYGYKRFLDQLAYLCGWLSLAVDPPRDEEEAKVLSSFNAHVVGPRPVQCCHPIYIQFGTTFVATFAAAAAATGFLSNLLLRKDKNRLGKLGRFLALFPQAVCSLDNLPNLQPRFSPEELTHRATLANIHQNSLAVAHFLRL